MKQQDIPSELVERDWRGYWRRINNTEREMKGAIFPPFFVSKSSGVKYEKKEREREQRGKAELGKKS